MHGTNSSGNVKFPSIFLNLPVPPRLVWPPFMHMGQNSVTGELLFTIAKEFLFDICKDNFMTNNYVKTIFMTSDEAAEFYKFKIQHFCRHNTAPWYSPTYCKFPEISPTLFPFPELLSTFSRWC